MNVYDRFRWMLQKRSAYRNAFLGKGDPKHLPADRGFVLEDLARFCRNGQTSLVRSPVTQAVDPIASAALEGRREVWHRIQYYLNLTDDQLKALKDQARDD